MQTDQQAHTGFIADGYSLPAFLAGVPRLYQPLRFTFRPMLTEEVAELFEAGPKLSAKEAERRSAKIIAARVTRWDLKTPDGREVLVTEEACRRLNRRLFQRLLAVVMGLEAPDEDPEGTEADRKELADIREEAARTGTMPGQVREQAAAKNS